MSSVLPPGSPDATGLFGMLRSWLRDGSARSAPNPDRVADLGRPGLLAEKSVRVLVVDDNSMNLAVISALLASKGLAPLLAADGSEALLLAREMPFDLILMDLQMPVMDGFQATEAIRHFEAASGRAAVPIVAYSSTSLSARVLATYGINDALAKPCDENDLEACLVRWCPGYRAQAAQPGNAAPGP